MNLISFCTQNVDVSTLILKKLPMFYRIVLAITCKKLRRRITSFNKTYPMGLSSLVNEYHQTNPNYKFKAMAGLKIFMWLFDIENKSTVIFSNTTEFDSHNCEIYYDSILLIDNGTPE